MHGHPSTLSLVTSAATSRESEYELSGPVPTCTERQNLRIDSSFTPLTARNGANGSWPMETKVENVMTRHFPARRLATSLVSALLLVGAASPALAERQDKDDDQDARKQQSDRKPAQRPEPALRTAPPQEQRPQPRPEPVRVEAPAQRPVLQQGNRRPQPERQENWDQASREREQQRRENLDIQTRQHAAQFSLAMVAMRTRVQRGLVQGYLG